MVYIHDFINILNKTLDNRFPNTGRFIVRGGDYIKDVVVELREKDKVLRYSPYELFNTSIDYDSTIDELIKQWENIIKE